MSEKKLTDNEVKPGELVIATAPDRILARIQKDGTILYGPEYTPDETAKILWEAVAKQRAHAVEREAVMGHIEHVMVKLGDQDLRYEACQAKATSLGATPDDVFQAERARQQLEVYVHQLIELARGLALRKPLTAPIVRETFDDRDEEDFNGFTDGDDEIPPDTTLN